MGEGYGNYLELHIALLLLIEINNHCVCKLWQTDKYDVHCLIINFTGTVFNNANQHINVYGDDIEVDYRGYEVHT